MKDKEKSNLPLVNERIPGPKVQLIDSSGENVGVVSKFTAINMAEEEGLDLVLLADSGQSGFPVAKIMDFGKAIYSKKKKAGEAKKKQKVIKVKEIKVRPKIGEHDLNTKLKQAAQFLKDGCRIKFTLVFRGREAVTKHEVAPVLFSKFESMIKELGVEHLMSEGDSKAGQFWSKIYYSK